MNAEDLLNEGFSATAFPGEIDDTLREKREKLLTIVVAGKSKAFLGVDIAPDQVQALSPEEINTYFFRYERVLGSKMVNSLGKTIIKMYSKVMSHFVGVDSEDDLSHDLHQDPIISHSLGSVACDLYYRFGTLLAPMAAGLITFNHLNFSSIKSKQPHANECGDQSNDLSNESNTNESNTNESTTNPTFISGNESQESR